MIQLLTEMFSYAFMTRAIIVGLLIAITCTLFVRKIKKQTLKASFALVPYLSVGILFAYFI